MGKPQHSQKLKEVKEISGSRHNPSVSQTNLPPESGGRPGQSSENSPLNAVLRDGEIITVGDEVTTTWYNCEGYIFVVFEVTPFENCDSKFLVNVHLRGYPERVLKTSDGRGLDANWFKKVKYDDTSGAK